MTLGHARVIKNAFAADASARTAQSPRTARVVPAEVLDARADAEAILARAREDADAIVAATRAEIREQELARLAAGFLALKQAEENRAERDLDRAIELAVVLAERLVGEALRVEPARVAELAASALQEVRGARRLRIEASPDDVGALEGTLGTIVSNVEVVADPALARGSLVVHTDLGRVDARLEPQLDRLAVALREALR